MSDYSKLCLDPLPILSLWLHRESSRELLWQETTVRRRPSTYLHVRAFFSTAYIYMYHSQVLWPYTYFCIYCLLHYTTPSSFITVLCMQVEGSLLVYFPFPSFRDNHPIYIAVPYIYTYASLRLFYFNRLSTTPQSAPHRRILFQWVQSLRV